MQGQEDFTIRAPGDASSPRHGYQGDRGAPVKPPSVPTGLTIAISREAGARGGSIGRRVARKLGWQVYDQELIEYMAQHPTVSQDLLAGLSAAAAAWVRDGFESMSRALELDRVPNFANLVRVILALGATGEIVLIGRGAGWILPRESTLPVRIVAPLSDRIAYMGQWLRLTTEEAAQRVRLRDSRRVDFLNNHLHVQPGDVNQYDLVLNSCTLGEDLCADLIVQAARARITVRAGEPAP